MIVDIIIKVADGAVAQGGVTFIWRAKEWAQQNQSELPVIAISGSYVNRGMQNILDIASQIGADEVLQKPFPPNRMQELIAKLLPGKHWRTGAAITLARTCAKLWGGQGFCISGATTSPISVSEDPV